MSYEIKISSRKSFQHYLKEILTKKDEMGGGISLPLTRMPNCVRVR